MFLIALRLIIVLACLVMGACAVRAEPAGRALSVDDMLKVEGTGAAMFVRDHEAVAGLIGLRRGWLRRLFLHQGNGTA